MSDIIKTYNFKFENNSLICVNINDQSVDIKVGELFGIDNPEMQIEDDIHFLNEIHRTHLITKDLLIAAEQWWKIKGHKEFLKTLEPWDSRLICAEVDDLNKKICHLEKSLAEALDEMNWWKKKHKEDCQEIRLVGRREGEKDMKTKCYDICIKVARSESYYSDNVADECAEEISKLEISRKLP